MLLLIVFGAVGCAFDAHAQRMPREKKRRIAAPTPPQAGQAIPFVDAHVHLNDVPMQLALMKAYGVSRAVVFWGRNSDNASILKAARAHPDQLIPFVSVSPERAAYRKMWLRQDPTLLVMLEDLLKSGSFKGIGEISVTHFPAPGFPETDFSPISPLMRGIMALARKYKVPVMIHCEITRLKEVSELLDAFKDVPVIWAHGGYTPYFIAKRMLETHANLYYELSARTWLNHPRSPDYTIFKNASTVWPRWLELIEAIPHRFLVGTDASHHSRQRERMKIVRVQLLLRQLSPQTRRLVAVENVLRLVQRD